MTHDEIRKMARRILAEYEPGPENATELYLLKVKHPDQGFSVESKEGQEEMEDGTFERFRSMKDVEAHILRKRKP